MVSETAEMKKIQMVEQSNRPRRVVASSETAREINRDVLLHAIHLHQPVSRADLARLTGLQPSTVSVIIGQLIDEGWVVPGSQGRLPRGRRPTFVMLNDQHVTLAIDLRPGQAILAVVDINGKILERDSVAYEISTSSAADEAKKAILQIVKKARVLHASYSDRVFQGLGVSVSGRVNQKTRRLLFSPNVPWGQIDLYAELEKVLEAPVEMENAAIACLFSERWFGTFNDVSNLLVVSVSDGIGTGILIDGRVARGRDGMAGEFGHMPIEETGTVCGCGNVGCWETFASNRAGLRYYHELAPESTLNSFGELLDLAQAGDIRALRSIDKMVSYLGRGLTILAAGLAPDAIIVAGDCTALWQRIYPQLESQLIAKSFVPQPPRLVAAMEGDLARLRGAAALVMQRVLFQQAEFIPRPLRGGERSRSKSAVARA